eukprot:scaffold1134_cov295-Prasinococcus_capsulatus_cf.AAC.14
MEELMRNSGSSCACPPFRKAHKMSLKPQNTTGHNDDTINNVPASLPIPLPLEKVSNRMANPSTSSRFNRTTRIP